MRRVDCEHLEEVLMAACRGSAEWDGHLAECGGCRDAVKVAAAFEGAREETLAAVALPDAGIVWRRAQLRATREAIAEAGRPITVAQVVAFGASMGLIGACFGATSKGFQAFMGWMGANWGPAVQAAVAEHWLLGVCVVAAVLAVPTAVYAVLGRE